MLKDLEHNHFGLSIEALEDRVLLSSVQVFAAGDIGDEAFDLVLSNDVVASFQLIGSDQAIYSYDSDVDVSINDLKIQFTNDEFDSATGYDRNLIIDRVVLDG